MRTTSRVLRLLSLFLIALMPAWLSRETLTQAEEPAKESNETPAAESEAADEDSPEAVMEALLKKIGIDELQIDRYLEQFDGSDEQARDAFIGQLKAIVESNASATARPAEKTDQPAANIGTHRRVGEIKVAADGCGSLQTFCVGAGGQVFALVAPQAGYGAAAVDTAEAEHPPAQVRVFNTGGELLRKFDVPFAAQRIAAAPNGEIFLAGAGRIARFNAAGELQTEQDLPHLQSLRENDAALREQAEEQIKSSAQSYRQELENFTKQKERLLERKQELQQAQQDGSAKPDQPAGDDASAGEGQGKPAKSAAKPKKRSRPTTVAKLDAQLEQVEQMISTYESAIKQQESQSVDDIVVQLTSQLQSVHAISVTDEDIFLATRVAKGYGFAVWRTDLKFQNPVQIITDLSGCCGQMDIKAHDGELFVAENSRHRVRRFDRDGAVLGEFGGRDRQAQAGAFGGCCNPMNLCFAADGSLLTAESEGKLKRFSVEGEFLGEVAAVKLTGGCKHVAVAAGDDGKLFFFDLPGGQIVVLEPAEADEAE